MSRIVYRVRECDDEAAWNHVGGPIGSDYALCGLTLDGDESVIESQLKINGEITCPKCWAVIECVRSIKDRNTTLSTAPAADGEGE